MPADHDLPKAQSASFGHVLFACARLLDETAQAVINEEAGHQLVKPSLIRLIPFLSTDGIRPTELAALVDVSKQAIGQSLAELEARGFVEYVDDPSDGRARLVRLSKGGIKASKYGLSVLAKLESELGRRVGKRTVAQAFRALQLMLPAIEEMRAAKRAR